MAEKPKSFMESLRNYLSLLGGGKVFSIITIIAVALAIPLTVLMSQQQQKTRQYASELVSPPFPSPTPEIENRVFVTSSSYDGNLQSAGSKFGLGIATDGLDGADKICQGTANIANLGGTWKAWISDNTTPAASRLIHSNNPYKLLNGTIIANNWDDLTDGSLQNDIKISDTGSEILNAKVWTATDLNGEIYTRTIEGKTYLANTCNNWTYSGSTSYSGDGGNTTDRTPSIYGPGSTWTTRHGGVCNTTGSIYCFEDSAKGAIRIKLLDYDSKQPLPDVSNVNTMIKNGDFSSTKKGPEVYFDNLTLGQTYEVYVDNPPGYTHRASICGSDCQAFGEQQCLRKLPAKIPSENQEIQCLYSKSLVCGNSGDVDADGVISKADSDMVLNSLVGNVTLTDGEKKRADVTGDSKVGNADAVAITKYIAGNLKTFPACLLPPCQSLGDISLDESVTNYDAKMISEYIVGTRTLTDTQMKNADVTGDGKVGNADAVGVTQYVAGIISTFPACPK